MICVDDLRPELGCFGQRHMVTPNIDRLAEESRVFARHYVQSAVCGPSRCSMLTGQRFNDWDCWKNMRERGTEPERPASFAHLLRREAYRTVCVGKVSHQPGGVMDPEQTVHQVPFSWDKAYAPVGPWETPWRAFFSYDKGKAYNKVIKMRKDEPRLPYESADVPDDGYADGLNAEAGVKELRELAGGHEPFLLAVGFYKPHLPFNAPKKYWDLYSDEAVGLAANRSLPEGLDPAISVHNSNELTTHYEWPDGPGNISDEKARLLRRGYMACVSYADAQIGKVLDEYRRLGLEKNTIVVLWSDHGWHLGEHGLFGKHTNFEVAARSPLMIKTPGMAEPGGRARGLVESVDLYPTLARLCGVAPPAGLAGKSLAPMLEDPEAEGKDFAYSFYPRKNLLGRTLRSERYRVIAWFDSDMKAVQVELYDHVSDPEENVNIAGEKPEIARTLVDRARRAQDPLKQL